MRLRDKACEELGITEGDVLRGPQITPQLQTIAASFRRDSRESMIPGTGTDLAQNWSRYLSSCEEPEAQRVLAAYYSIPKTHRKLLPIEAFCVAAGVSPIRILGMLTATCVSMGAHASTIIAAVSHPRVVQKSVDMALTDEGIADRRMLHLATRFLPTPKGSNTTITVQQNATAAVANTSAPPPEATIRRMVDRFNDRTTIVPPQIEAEVTTLVPEPHAAAIEAEYLDEDE